MLFPILTIPVLSLVFVVWAVATRRLDDRTRRATMVAAIVLGCGVSTLVRTGGFTGNFDNDLAWRWTTTPEERLLAQASEEPKPLSPAPAAAAVARDPAPTPARKPAATPTVPGSAETTPANPQAAESTHAAAEPARATPVASLAAKAVADWPGFRGRERDGIVRGVRIETDWSAKPPVPLWRRPIGPGWSSFAVRGDLLYTQEQRGDDEVVAAYHVTTGEPVWKHRDRGSLLGVECRRRSARDADFEQRSCLHAWRNRSRERARCRVPARSCGPQRGVRYGREAPDWGFAGSPLVVDDLVVVAASGALVAYEIATGKPRWKGPVGGEGYSSPQLVTIGGVSQILLLSGSGLTSVAPADGKRLWEHAVERLSASCSPPRRRTATC